MPASYVIALDQGTTSSRAVLVDRQGRIVDAVQNPFPQIFPQPGWVEHDPRDILSSQLGALTELLVQNGLGPADIDSIGITNQRETTVVWNRETGQPVCNAIVWQCRRTADIVDLLTSDPKVAQAIAQKTGLVPDPYFSASKIKWILDNVPGAREDAEAGKLAFGTVDTWLIWTLTHGAVHATDVTNASRTMLFDIHEMRWDPWLLDLFGIPASMLPEVRPSSGDFGVTASPGVLAGIPIRGVAGDQQAALFGQCCFRPGQAKNTYGTGCFLLLNTGSEACASTHGLVTTIAASAPGQGTVYALEGSVFMAGALMQWLRDELGLISSARGAILGLTRGANRAHIVRAALESLAFQVADLVGAMEADAGFPFREVHVDGGASANDFLMQFQCDILGCTLLRPACLETTALGAAFLAGLSTGFWKDVDELVSLRADEQLFTPVMRVERREGLLEGWHDAVRRVMVQ